MRIHTHAQRPRGIASLLAILFLAILGAFAVTMMSMTMKNTQMAYSQTGAERALMNAESGLRFMTWKFSTVTMPSTLIGVITDAQAKTLWPTVITNIKSDLTTNMPTVPKDNTDADGTASSTTLHIGPVACGNDIKFDVYAKPSPDYPTSSQVIQIKAIGQYGSGTNQNKRVMTMNCLMQKNLRYGVVAKIPIQLGKNTLVEGDVYYAAANSKGATVPPVLSVSDFRYTSGTTSDALTTKIQTFQTFLANTSNYNGVDNRVRPTDPAWPTLIAAGYSDYNGDGYIDEYDIALKYFDSSGDHRISQSEFSSAAPNDPNLFYVIDKSLGKPWASTDTPRQGYDDGYVDGLDPYAKVKGTIRIWDSKSALASRIAPAFSGGIPDAMQGVLASADGYTPAVLYEQNSTTDPAVTMTPSSFSMGPFLALAGTNAGSNSTPSATPSATVTTPTTARMYANTTVPISGTKSINTGILKSNALVTSWTSNSSTIASTSGSGSSTVVLKVTENVPYGSTSPRSTVTRPVVTGINFKNCVIPRGTNALFVNCTFDGVTFVDGAYNLTQDTAGYSNGNNLRFEGCTFTGPLVQGDALNTGSYKAVCPTNYTDYTNSWEFTGATTIDLRATTEGGIGSLDGTVDSADLAAIKEQATIMAPQTNIEMGSYTNPASAQCSFQGIVVAGCFDVRGTANIDGTIIVPATAAGNVTLGYFGADDNSTNQGQPDPTLKNSGFGSYGRIYIRFNPFRTLPDGINLAMAILPDISSRHEVPQ